MSLTLHANQNQEISRLQKHLNHHQHPDQIMSRRRKKMRKKCHKRENERIFFAVQNKNKKKQEKKTSLPKKIFKKENSFNIRMRKRVKEVEKKPIRTKRLLSVWK